MCPCPISPAGPAAASMTTDGHLATCCKTRLQHLEDDDNDDEEDDDEEFKIDDDYYNAYNNDEDGRNVDKCLWSVLSRDNIWN